MELKIITIEDLLTHLDPEEELFKMFFLELPNDDPATIFYLTFTNIKIPGHIGDLT